MDVGAPVGLELTSGCNIALHFFIYCLPER